jgi:hypothetical protein
MECNLSNWERGIRIGIGVGLFSVGLFAGLTGWQAAMADSLGAIAVFTGAAGSARYGTYSVSTHARASTRLMPRKHEIAWEFLEGHNGA